MKNIIPKLGLKFLRDSEITEYAQDKVEKLNAAAAFSSVIPSTAEVSAKLQQYTASLVKADNGTKADTEYKNQQRAELELMLMLQSADAARIANGDLPLYLSTGYEAKNTKGSPSGSLEQVKRLDLFYGDNAGELKARWDTMPRAINFTVQVYSDITHPESSLVKEYIKGRTGKRKTTLSGLPSGQIIFVRVRANGVGSSFGPWSDPAEKRVP